MKLLYLNEFKQAPASLDSKFQTFIKQFYTIILLEAFWIDSFKTMTAALLHQSSEFKNTNNSIQEVKIRRGFVYVMSYFSNNIKFNYYSVS